MGKLRGNSPRIEESAEIFARTTGMRRLLHAMYMATVKCSEYAVIRVVSLHFARETGTYKS